MCITSVLCSTRSVAALSSAAVTSISSLTFFRTPAWKKQKHTKCIYSKRSLQLYERKWAPNPLISSSLKHFTEEHLICPISILSYAFTLYTVPLEKKSMCGVPGSGQANILNSSAQWRSPNQQRDSPNKVGKKLKSGRSNCNSKLC